MSNVNVDVLSALPIIEQVNWVVWRNDKRGDKTTKVPYTPGTENKADASDATTWRTFEMALDSYNSGEWAGIGFEFSYSGVVGIDLDDCTDDAGMPLPWAQEIVNDIDSYTELSVSGRGIHILAYGEIPATGAAKHPVEVYAAGRYFALTGNIIDSKSTIEQRDKALLTFYINHFGKVKTAADVTPGAPRDISGEDIANAAKWVEQLSLTRCEEYDSWLKVGMALSELGEVGLALWDRWSAKSDKYTPGACRTKWRTIEPGAGITLASLRHWAEEDAEQPTKVNGVAFKIAERELSIQHDCLFVEGRNGKRQVSTFMFYPKRLLTDVDSGGEDAILGDIAASGRRWPDVIMPKSAFSSAASLCKALPSIYWQWTGTDNDTKLFLLYISSLLEDGGMPQASSTAVVGRHGNFWVSKELTMDSEVIYSRGDAPILYRSPEVQVRNKLSDTAPSLALSFPDNDEYAELVREISHNLFYCNHPDAVALMIGWFMACPLMSIFQQAGIRFPHLNIFGTKGSGKTTSVVRLFLPLLGQPRPSTWTPNTTMFVIRSLFSASNGVPISFGEFRAATLQSSRSDFLRILLMAYDTGRDARGQADLSTKTYDLLAPVVIDGEDALSDPALRERSIFINLHPEHITENTPAFAAMQTLMSLPLHDFAANYLRYTLTIGPDEITTVFRQHLAETKGCELALPDRMRRNIAVVMTGMSIYNQFVVAFGGTQIPVSVSSFQGMIRNQGILLNDGRSRSSVDDFVEDLVAYVSSSADYHFSFLLRYEPAVNVLWFHLPSAHAWWTKQLRQRGATGLELAALRAQLHERTMDGYAIPETIKTTAKNGKLPCFGVSLSQCLEIGLNVVEKLDPTTIEVRGGM